MRNKQGVGLDVGSASASGSSNQIMKKILLLHFPILCCLFVLTDHQTNYSDGDFDASGNSIVNTNKRHLAVFTALSRHPPSMRVYRGIFELLLLGFCASLSLYIWERVVDRRIIAKLLFDVPYTLKGNPTPHFAQSENSGSGRGCSFDGDYVHCGDEDGDGEDDEDDETATEREHNEDGHNENNDVIQEKHTNDIDYDSIQIPSSTFVLNKALDSLLLLLISLFLFTVSSSAGGEYIDQTKTEQPILSQISLIAAPIFPLLLFLFFGIQLFFPWTTSKYHFWTCLSYTIGAPLYDVTFRDGFIGDIFTSAVRPMQDIAYTTFYLLSGLQGWWVVYRHNDSSATAATLEEDIILQPVEHSWLLHTIILPACLVSPLWWRYCQTLRQCYDTKRRWPYLGNSFKYFLAAQVVIFGVFFGPNQGNHFSWWLCLYVLATIYQIMWDIFMDWELLVWNESSGFFELRKQRLYSCKSLYVVIVLLNVVLRFGWILNFIPMTYLSATTGVLEYTFSADFSTFVSPLLACAEIIRRTMWGFIRFELESIKVMKKEQDELATRQHGIEIEKGSTNEMPSMNDDFGNDGIEMKPMSIATKVNNPKNMISFKSLSTVTFKNDLSTADDVQILWELCVYATIFTGMGVIAAVHRQVL